MTSIEFLNRLSEEAEHRPERLFAKFGEDHLTAGRLHREAEAFAAHITSSGVERVAVMMDNSLAQITLIFGLAMSGITWVPVNPRLVGQGLGYILQHSDPQRIIADPDYFSAISECGLDLARIELTASDQLTSIFEGSGRPVQTDAPPGDFALMYTSGTTGPPKGVQVTQRMMDFAGEGVRIGSGAADGDVMFMWEPLCHIGGAQMLILPLLVDVHLAMVPRFSARQFWDQVTAAEATHIHYLGGILQMLLKQPVRAEDKNHGVKAAWGGGCPAETWTAFEERFAIPIRECYGMSEASSLTSVNVSGKTGAVGKPMDWLNVQIETPGPDGRGEIVVREREPGALFSGYFRNREATKKALRNGALCTGDVGSFDADGDLWFHGRQGDAIRVRGENVSAWEVESVAGSHRDVEECAAIAVDAEIGEQEIKLFFRPATGARLSPQSLSDWLKPRLAAFQLPRFYELVEDFPHTPSQRIRKGELPRDTKNAWDRSKRRDG